MTALSARSYCYADTFYMPASRSTDFLASSDCGRVTAELRLGVVRSSDAMEADITRRLTGWHAWRVRPADPGAPHNWYAESQRGIILDRAGFRLVAGPRLAGGSDGVGTHFCYEIGVYEVAVPHWFLAAVLSAPA